jgi:hypothetical protein
VARFGDDATGIAFRKGRDARIVPWLKLRGADTMQVAARVAELAERHAADMVFIDGGGVGAGVVDRCRQLRVRCTEVQFGARPDGVALAGGLRCANKRAEMWAALREWLAGGAIPDEAELRADLGGVQYGFTAESAIALERKEEMKRRGLASPDAADALALTFAAPVLPSPLAGGPFGRAAAPAVLAEYDPWEAMK